MLFVLYDLIPRDPEHNLPENSPNQQIGSQIAKKSVYIVHLADNVPQFVVAATGTDTNLFSYVALQPGFAIPRTSLGLLLAPTTGTKRYIKEEPSHVLKHGRNGQKITLEIIYNAIPALINIDFRHYDLGIADKPTANRVFTQVNGTK
jgi:hypothetical protein